MKRCRSYHKKIAPDVTPPMSEASSQKSYPINARLCHQLTEELLQLPDIIEASVTPAIHW
jgi:hypothetical protein